jgi:hypothetical protein
LKTLRVFHPPIRMQSSSPTSVSECRQLIEQCGLAANAIDTEYRIRNVTGAVQNV